MSYVLPIFITGEDIQEEFIKGVELRFKMANSVEANKITPVVIKDLPTKKVIKQYNTQGCYIGIVMQGSQEIEQIVENKLEDFIFVAPLASAVKAKNVVPLILSEWEADAIKKILERRNIKDKEEVAILTDLNKDSPYLKPFKETFNNIKVIKADNLNTEATKDLKTYIVYAENNKWDLIKKILLLSTAFVFGRDEIIKQVIKHVKKNINEENLKDLIEQEIEKIQEALSSLFEKLHKKEVFVITTSAFENWQISPILRKELAGVHYSYPKLSDDANKVVEEFEKEFGYKPSIISLLAYDAVSIAIKTLLEVSLPGYKSIKDYIFHNIFDLKVTGKSAFPFDENGIKPLLIGKSHKELFETKYIGEKGNYENLTKIGENNDSISS